MPDPVADYLRTVKTSDAVRAQAWDAVSLAKDDADLTVRLQRLPVPNSVRAQLFDLKPMHDQTAPAAPDAPAPAPTSALSTAADVGTGIVKGAASTAFGLGKIVHDYTPIGRISDAIQPDAFAQRPAAIEPSNTAQRIGFGGEQVGEFFLPTGEVGALAKLPNRALKAAEAFGLTLAQSGSPAEAGVSGALTAALPGASAAERAEARLRVSAEKEMARALGATKESMKEEAAKLAPQMLERGVGGSREAMLQRARSESGRFGGLLRQAYADAAAAGTTVDGFTIRDAMRQSKSAFYTTTATGAPLLIPGTEQIVKKLDALDAFVAKLGPDIPVDKAAHIKQTWDGIVSNAGLFGSKATSSATDNASARALKDASNSFRALLNANPTIADLNKEASFWIGLRKVLAATEKRTQAQGGGLISAGMGGSGAVVGAMTGDSASDKAEKAVLYGLAGRQLIKVVQSPAFRTRVAGPLKDALADALASGSSARIRGALGRITAAMPAQVVPAAAQ